MAVFGTLLRAIKRPAAQSFALLVATVFILGGMFATGFTGQLSTCAYYSVVALLLCYLLKITNTLCQEIKELPDNGRDTDDVAEN